MSGLPQQSTDATRRIDGEESRLEVQSLWGHQQSGNTLSSLQDGNYCADRTWVRILSELLWKNELELRWSNRLALDQVIPTIPHRVLEIAHRWKPAGPAIRPASRFDVGSPRHAHTSNSRGGASRLRSPKRVWQTASGSSNSQAPIHESGFVSP